MADAGPAAARSDGTCYLRDFRFDRATHRLWHGTDEVPLRPKAAAVLAHLVDHAGDLVLKEHLLDAVWPDGYVGDAALSVCVNELRHALHDDAHEPRFIATAHRRGYRLVADISTMPAEVRPTDRIFVGRESELTTLHRSWQESLGGRRTFAFVAAPAGTGKTALVDAFVDRILAEGIPLLVGSGQCVELGGAGEPYLPVLEAMASLWRGPRGAAVGETLRRSAASWLMQLPALFTDTELTSLRRRAGRASTPRLLRDFAVAMEQLSTVRPVLLVFEDLHHADRSTVELLSYLARRKEPARLLVLGTYRPSDLIATTHPLHQVAQDLRAHGLVNHLALELFSPHDIRAYLAARLAPRIPSDRLVEGVTERTEGNALFVVSLCEHLLRDGLLVDRERSGVDVLERLARLGVPSEVRLMLEQQVDALDEADRKVLETASAVGMDFAADTVAAGLGTMPVVEVERRCSRLARLGSALSPAGTGEWPDGSATARFRFTHAMYREILYERTGPARRVELHRAIGSQLMSAYGESAAQLAPELAVHFERGRDYEPAVHWMATAAATAVARSAYPEAQAHVQHALGILPRVDDARSRDRLELALRRTEVVGAAATWGWRESRARDGCARLEHLATAAQDVPALVAALLGLHNAAMMEGDEPGMRECLRRIDGLVGATGDPAARLVADLLHIRDESRDARYARMWERAQRMLELCARVDHADLVAIVGDELEVAAHLYGGLALWQLGFADQARSHAAAALDGARDQGVPAGLARALWFAAMIHLLCGAAERVAELADELENLCARHDLAILRAGATVLDGWAIGTLGDPAAGLARIRDGAASWSGLAGIGDALHHRLAAELHLRLGDASGGLTATRAGLEAAARTRSAQSEPELWRLRGELLLLGGPAYAEAEAALSKALELTTGRGIRGFGLRAATSMARLRHTQGRADAVLADAYATFTEGFNTRDLIEARAALGL